jgi:hypothetical protein
MPSASEACNWLFIIFSSLQLAPLLKVRNGSIC